MRRDLAVYRAQRSPARPKQHTLQTAAAPTNEVTNTVTVAQDDADIIMGDSPNHQQNPSPPKQATTASEKDQDAKPNSPLYQDIPGQDHQAAGHPGDEITGTHSNFDFESLFNDPGSSAGATSCGSPKDLTPPPPSQPQSKPQASLSPIEAEKPAPTTTTTEPPRTESQDANNNENDDHDNEFDFADLTNFGADTDMQDTDGISSLLPGLEDYANSSSGNANANTNNNNSTSADFDISNAAGAGDFASTVPPAAAAALDDQKSAAANKRQEPHHHDSRDDTFDDIMNFSNFDLGDFNGGGAGGEAGENKFDDSYFDI
jgi:hypothetical protein